MGHILVHTSGNESVRQRLPVLSDTPMICVVVDLAIVEQRGCEARNGVDPIFLALW